jgi:hypothetical protein
MILTGENSERNLSQCHFVHHKSGMPKININQCFFILLYCGAALQIEVFYGTPTMFLSWQYRQSKENGDREFFCLFVGK